MLWFSCSLQNILTRQPQKQEPNSQKMHSTWQAQGFYQCHHPKKDAPREKGEPFFKELSALASACHGVSYGQPPGSSDLDFEDSPCFFSKHILSRRKKNSVVWKAVAVVWLVQYLIPSKTTL